MRKPIVLLTLLLVLAVCSVYFIVPSTLHFSANRALHANANAFTRLFLREEPNQHPWINADSGGRLFTNKFRYNNSQFTVVQNKFASKLFSITNGKDSVQAELLVIPLSQDSLQINWQGAVNTSANPIVRISQNKTVKQFSADMEAVLQDLQAYCSNEDRLYNLQIKPQLVVDSMLIYSSITSPQKPSTETIYALVDKLRAFAQKHNAAQSGNPMLNINMDSDGSYLTRVALPVNQMIADEGEVHYKRMLGRGNILVAQITGGPAQIDQAFAILKQYTEDHNRIAPAIPFQSLVTDRRLVTDSSKWVTKIYCPVM